MIESLKNYFFYKKISKNVISKMKRFLTFKTFHFGEIRKIIEWRSFDYQSGKFWICCCQDISSQSQKKNTKKDFRHRKIFNLKNEKFLELQTQKSRCHLKDQWKNNPSQPILVQYYEYWWSYGSICRKSYFSE